MHEVVGYIHRHPSTPGATAFGDTAETALRYSFMNWGHDPLKKS